MPTEIQEPEFITANTDCRAISNDTVKTNPSTSDQSQSVSQEQMKDFLSTVMQAIKESANQTAALVQEESRKQTELVQEESQKQTAESARQNAETSKQIMALVQEESKKQTALVQEESKKQTALVQEESRKQAAESAKLASAIQNLRAEIRKENENLAKSLTAKFEAVHSKVREDFAVQLDSEIQTVSVRINEIR
jgi:hypothetical protein